MIQPVIYYATQTCAIIDGLEILHELFIRREFVDKWSKRLLLIKIGSH